MMRKILFAALMGVMPALVAGQTVTVTLSSPQNGQNVAPGAPVSWEVEFSVSAGDNAGLALLACDLTQDALNPAFLDVPHADGVPVPMTNFARPAGVTNPNDAGRTGYRGSQRGTAGQRDLLQIGGAQNTFGQALPPGTGLAENANTVAGVGQSGPVLLAAGSFLAPASAGTYTFSLANIRANVMEVRNAPPLVSPVVEATVNATGTSFSFNVGGCAPCDTNCDGSINSFDIQPFVDILSGGGSLCSPCAADTNGDGSINSFDIQGFVECLGG